jgi:hypothetical protein
VASEAHLADGIALAFMVDAALALAGLAVVFVFLGGRRHTPADRPAEHPRALRHRHRANA